MASFDKSYKILIQLEYAKNPNSFLHLNRGENGYTLAGIYQRWHKDSIDWNFIQRVITMCDDNITIASSLLYRDKEIHKQIISVFKKEYWLHNRLNEIESQLIADEIFISATNIGNKEAIKMAQQLVNVNDDGIVGVNTIRALNEHNEDDFSRLFDEKEKSKYRDIVANNPSLSRNLKGWLNRSRAV